MRCRCGGAGRRFLILMKSRKWKMYGLFAGIGGFEYAAQEVWGDELEIVGMCEIDSFCRKVLKKHWPNVAIHEDIRSLDGNEIKERFGAIDLITGGFPCQPYSLAGKRRGAADDRALWDEMYRIITEVRPRWIIVENVPGIINMVLDDVLSCMEDSVYTCETFIIPACSIGAPHRRNRVWIVAYDAQQVNGGFINKSSKGQIQQSGKCAEQDIAGYSDRWDSNEREIEEILQREKTKSARSDKFIESTANLKQSGLPESGFTRIGELSKKNEKAVDNRSQQQDSSAGVWRYFIAYLNGKKVWIESWWQGRKKGKMETECRVIDTNFDRAGSPLGEMRGTDLGEEFNTAERNYWKISWLQAVEQFCRVDDGISAGMDRDRRKRISAIGNAIVPQVAMVIMAAIKTIEEEGI